MSALRDKADNLRGLLERTAEAKQVTTYQHIVQIDTRDCVGVDSLAQARLAFQAQGGRSEASGLILGSTGLGISPIKINIQLILPSILRNGDTVTISGVQGNTVCNDTWKIFNVTTTSFEIGGIGLGNYAGGGQWFRAEDNGYPNISSTTCTINGNEMIILLNKRLKAIRSIGLNISIIPRDIIPINCYYRDLYTASLGGSPTLIPQETKFMTSASYGFYSSNISLFRTYTGTWAMPNQVTPPPLNLWNPPLGPWPTGQPISYAQQTVPTYVSNIFNIPGYSGNFLLVCSGYGVYDLLDWTFNTGNPIEDRANTELARKALLLTIVRPQMYNNVNYNVLINNCSTTSNNIYPFGYGIFQRFICGPGLQLNYQPGSTDGENPSVPQVDSQIAFPNFRGNVWGPYDAPGERFQKMGLRDTLQDLFLNGDLDNLFGIPVLNPNLQINQFLTDPNYGLNTGFVSVDFSNFSTSTSPNILNAMRIVSNGFGAVTVTAQGQGNPDYTVVYQDSGGIGPSTFGAPSAWSLTGVYGPPNLGDPNAVGPLSWNLLSNGQVPQTGVGNLPPNYPGQTAAISHKFGWYDLGPNQGYFKTSIKSYTVYAGINIPATNLVIQVFQFPRNERVQSTNSDVGPSIFNVPVRLFPDFSDGGFAYMEGIYSLLSQTSDLEYWGQRFLNPLASLDKINLRFFTYEGVPIPLERQLAYNYPGYFTNNLSPLLRSKRFISLLFRIECYQYVNVGLNIMEQVDKILGIVEENNDDYEFNVRAVNYEDYL